MSKNSKNNNKNPPTSSCFTTILQRFICTGNLPTHPSPPDHQIFEIPERSSSCSHPISNLGGAVIVVKSKDDQTRVRAQVSNSPGVIAKLMGLDSLPKYENATTLDSLFRSKSLNSLHFLPDFDPTRAAFHRRARTSASFHEQGNGVLGRIDENVVMSEVKQNKEKKVKEVVLKGNEGKKSIENSGRVKDRGSSRKKYEECYYASSRRCRRLKNSVGENNGVGNNSNIREKCDVQKRKLVKRGKNGKVGSTILSKKKVDHKQMCIVEVQHDDQLLLSKSPVSVLDHDQENVPTTKGDRRQITSASRRKSSPKINFYDNLAQDTAPKLKQGSQDCCRKIVSKQEFVKVEEEVADNFVEILGNMSKLAEDHIRDSKWLKKYELMKLHFVEELCIDLGQEILGLLIDELVDELIMS